jgi:hypothetical protein
MGNAQRKARLADTAWAGDGQKRYGVVQQELDARIAVLCPANEARSQ